MPTTLHVAAASDRTPWRATLVAIAGTGSGRALGAVAGVLAARALGPGARGELSLLTSTALLGATIAAAGIPFWVAREVARTGRVDAGLPVVRRHACTVGAAVAAALVIVGGTRAASGLPTGITLDAIAATAWLVLAWTFHMILVAFPIGAGATGVTAAATTACSGSYLVLLAALAATTEVTAASAVACAVAAHLVAAAVASRFVRRTTGRTVGSPPTSATYRRALAFGVGGGAGDVMLLAMMRVDVFIVAAFLPLEAVGLYAVATGLSELLTAIPDGTAQVVLASSPRRPVAALLRPTLLAMAATGAVAIAVARPAIRLVFGAAFEPAATAVPPLVVAALALGAWKVLGAEVVARGRPLPRLVSACAGLATMVALDLLAVPRLGIAGAALGCAGGYAVAAAVVGSALRRRGAWP